MLTRRTFNALIPAGIVAGCAGQTAAQVSQEAVTYGTVIANGLLTVATLIPGIPANDLTIAKNAVNAAGTLTTSLTQTQGQPIVNQIVSAVGSVASAVSGMVPAGSEAANDLADVQTALPLLQAAIGIASTLAGAAPGTTAAQMAAMTRLQALPKAAS